MLICANNNISIKGLVPKNQYTGIILKLTSKEKEQIATLQHNIVELEDQYHRFNEYRIKNHLSSDSVFDKLFSLDAQITDLKKEIYSIKAQRLEKQKASEIKRANLDIII